MTHLDEGTIHAWLDGSFGAERTAEIESHLAQCAACSAAVAEARGFVAGASRILNALDDVPAGVTPKRAATPPPAVRQWRASRWVTSIAAALMLAIGITTWNRSAVRKDMPLLQPVEKAQTVAALVDSGAATDSSLRAAPARKSAIPLPTPPRSEFAAEGEQDTTRLRRTTATANRADGTRLRRTTVAPNREDALQRQSAEVASSAPTPAPSTASPVAAAEARRRLTFDTSLTLEQVVVTSTGGGGASEPARAAGCYPLSTVSDARRMAKVVGEVAGAAVGAARTSAGARASTRPNAPSAAASADFAASPPPMLRLDTLRRPLGYMVRSAASDSSVGWWNRWGTDSVRVDLLNSGVFILALKDRAVCPKR